MRVNKTAVSNYCTVVEFLPVVCEFNQMHNAIITWSSNDFKSSVSGIRMLHFWIINQPNECRNGVSVSTQNVYYPDQWSND